MRRAMTVFSVVAMVVAAAPAAVAAATAAPHRVAARAGVPACPDPHDEDDFAPLDFDGDVVSDTVVGVPTASAGAGVIDLRLSRSGTAQRVGESAFKGLPAPADIDRFGTAIAEADVDRNGCDDAIVGAPGSGGTGAVDIMFGTESGLSTTTAIRLVGKTQGERFGTSVVATPPDFYGNIDLFIGAPFRNVGAAIHAGAIDHYTISPTGTVRLVQTLTQDSPGVAGAPENADHFGSVLAVTRYATVDPGFLLTVGVPQEDIGSFDDAGMATVMQFNPDTHLLARSTSWNQNSAGVPGTAAAGDRFGAAVASEGYNVVIGIPGDTVGAARSAGAVQLLPYTNPGTTTDGDFATFTIGHYLDQNSPGVPGTAETGDSFGAAVMGSGYVVCSDSSIRPDGGVVVGSPGEGLGSTTGAGTVTIIPNVSAANATKCPGLLYYQGRGGLGGAYESGDHLGATLSDPGGTYYLRGFDAGFLAGVPGEDVGSVRDAGLVVYGPLYRYPLRHATLYDSAGPQPGEQYGSGQRPNN